MHRLRAATQEMVTLVGEAFGQLLAAFCMQRRDQGAGNQHGSIERSAVRFDTAGDIDGIAEHGELQVPVAANVAMDHFAVVDADGNPDRRVTGSTALLVPSVDRLQDVQRAARGIGGIARAGAGEPNTAIRPSPRNLSMVPSWANTAVFSNACRSRSIAITASGVMPEQYAVKPIMSTNSTAAGWHRATESGVSSSMRRSTNCGAKNRARFARCRSVSRRRSFADTPCNARNVVMEIAARLMMARIGAVPSRWRPCAKRKLRTVNAAQAAATIRMPRRP